MYKKRGQLTIFIIIGVLIVIVILGGYYGLSAYKQKVSNNYFESEGIRQEVTLLKNNIDSCLNDLSVLSLKTIGDQGGYYKKPKKTYELKQQDSLKHGKFLSYYYHEGELTLPKLTEIEYELSNFLNEKINKCLQEQQYTFNLKINAKTNVKIIPSQVNYELNGLLTLSTDKYTTNIDLTDYSKTQNIKLFEIYEIAEYLTNSHKENPENYCASCLLKMLETKDLQLNYYPLDENTMALEIKQTNNELNQDYYFIYLNKYTGHETQIIEPEVFPMPDPQI